MSTECQVVCSTAKTNVNFLPLFDTKENITPSELALALTFTLNVEEIVKYMSSDNVKTLEVHPLNLDAVIVYEDNNKKSIAMNKKSVEDKNTHAAIVDMAKQGIYTIEKRGDQKIVVWLCNGIIIIMDLGFMPIAACTLDIEKIVKYMSFDDVKALAVCPADLDVFKKESASATHAAIVGMIEQGIYTIKKRIIDQKIYTIEVRLWNGTEIYF